MGTTRRKPRLLTREEMTERGFPEDYRTVGSHPLVISGHQSDLAYRHRNVTCGTAAPPWVDLVHVVKDGITEPIEADEYGLTFCGRLIRAYLWAGPENEPCRLCSRCAARANEVQVVRARECGGLDEWPSAAAFQDGGEPLHVHYDDNPCVVYEGDDDWDADEREDQADNWEFLSWLSDALVEQETEPADRVACLGLWATLALRGVDTEALDLLLIPDVDRLVEILRSVGVDIGIRHP